MKILTWTKIDKKKYRKHSKNNIKNNNRYIEIVLTKKMISIRI